MPQRNDFRLRPIADTDLAQLLRWRNSERIRNNMYTDHIITSDEHQSWFDRLQTQQKDCYLIFEAFHKPVGVTYFTDINRKNGTCFWGFYLGEENLPRGIGSIMGVLGLEYAFEVLQIRKLCGEAFQFNSASINFFRRFGFMEEGHFAKHVLKNGRYEDVLSFALFNEDWQHNRLALEEKAYGMEDTCQ